MGRFYDRLQAQWNQGKFVCVGLDPDITKILPKGWIGDREYPGDRKVLYSHLVSVIDATHDIVVAYKPNWAFFLHYGSAGLEMLESLVAYIRYNYPDVVIILDAKVGDIGNTNIGYSQFAFGILDVDAVTVHPYMGHVAMQPFLDQADKGVIVLVRTSNEGAGELQDLVVDIGPERAHELGMLEWDNQPAGSDRGYYSSMALFEVLAINISTEWNYNGNCAVVVGATVPDELKQVRALVGDDIPILIPGVGAQGGDLEQAVRNGKNLRGDGFVINASRSVLYPKSPDGKAVVVNVAGAARAEVERMNSVITRTLFVPPNGNDV